MSTRWTPWALSVTVVVGCGGSAGTAGADGCLAAPSPDAWEASAPPRFVELWRAGGTNEGEDIALPISVEVAPDGRAAIPDYQLGLLGVDPDGAWRGDLARRGEGPGEVATPLAAIWTDEGHLGVFDFERARAVFVDRTGALVREDALDPRPIAQVIMRGELDGVGFGPDGTGYVQLDEPLRSSGEVAQILLRLPYGGAAADTVLRAVSPALNPTGLGDNVVAFGFPRLVFDVASDGRVALAGRSDRYEVTVLGPDGATTTICRSAAGHALRADETGEEVEGVDPTHPFIAPVRSAPRPERPAPIGRLFFGRDGRLWVERDRRSPFDLLGALYGRRGSRFDVFDPEGRYLGEVRAPARAYLMAATADRVWAFEIGPLDETWVVAYRLVTEGRSP